MKWTLRKSGYQRRGVGGGGCGQAADRGGGEAESLDPPSPSPHPLLSMGAHPGGRRSGPGLRRRSISSPLLISKAHYFVLRLAAGQDGSGLLRPLSALVSFLPSFLTSSSPSHSPPTPHQPLKRRTIIYFGEFLGYCFVRANQG